MHDIHLCATCEMGFVCMRHLSGGIYIPFLPSTVVLPIFANHCHLRGDFLVRELNEKEWRIQVVGLRQAQLDD